MKPLLAILAWTAAAASAAEPVRSVWILSASAAAGAERIRPDVHSVELSDDYVTVRSAGLSLQYLGPLQASPSPTEQIHEYTFRIPRHPQAAGANPPHLPADMIGVFVNGVPIYNQFEALSYNAANLWHYDPIAGCAQKGLLEKLAADTGRHSPIVGFALDGYPVYGPWAYANGGLKRMRSSYRVRPITQRHVWPDGAVLTPEQYGPDVDPANPLGTFAEDYEYVPGSGDLDESNGRFVKTPEYPDGTYAYFLATDDAGRLAFPYLIGPRFHGSIAQSASRSTTATRSFSRMTAIRSITRSRTPAVTGSGPISRCRVKRRAWRAST